MTCTLPVTFTCYFSTSACPHPVLSVTLNMHIYLNGLFPNPSICLWPLPCCTGWQLNLLPNLVSTLPPLPLHLCMPHKWVIVWATCFSTFHEAAGVLGNALLLNDIHIFPPVLEMKEEGRWERNSASLDVNFNLTSELPFPVSDIKTQNHLPLTAGLVGSVGLISYT